MTSPTPPPTAGKRKGPPAWRRRLPWFGAAALGALIVAGLWPQAVSVEMAPVSRGPLVVTVDEEGMTRVRQRYIVAAPVGGHLRRIDWKPGAPVEAGRTALAVLEPAGADFLDTRNQAQAEARLRAAEAARDAARAQRERAGAAARLFAAEFGRSRVLRDQKVLSVQEFEASQMKSETSEQEARAAEFSLRVAEFEVQQARAILSRGQTGANGVEPLIITSPVSGRILRVIQESARTVVAGFPLLEIGDATDLEARIEVLSRDAVAIRPGAKMLLERWGGSEPLAARVRLVEPSGFTKVSALGVEEQRVFVIADFTDPLEKRPTLGDNYRVEARIVTWENAGALRAPAGALFQNAGQWRVFVVRGGRAESRVVQVGRSNGVATEITGGLQEGEQVVVYPGDKVADGTAVSPLTVGTR
ncbi:MAG: HlyD family efflux transporter periplasmic adaptor subunit [Verrucomicrobiota bacterium]